MEVAHPTVDVTDPIVVMTTWGLTWAIGRLLRESEADAARAYLPVVAVALAVVIRSLIDNLSGREINMDTLLRALAAAGVAVLTHSQFREVVKAKAPKPTAKTRVTRPPNPKL